MTPWCPADKFEWYRVNILSARTLGIANNVVSLPGMVVNLNSKESNIIYFLQVIPLFSLLLSG